MEQTKKTLYFLNISHIHGNNTALVFGSKEDLDNHINYLDEQNKIDKSSMKIKEVVVSAAGDILDFTGVTPIEEVKAYTGYETPKNKYNDTTHSFTRNAIGKKPSDGFRDILRTIKKHNRGSNINTF